MTIDEYPVYEGYIMFKEVIYLHLFYCLCFVNNISKYMLDKQSRKYRDPYMEVQYYIMLSGDIGNHWNDVVEENNE